MDAAALGSKRIREQQFVIEDLADPVTDCVRQDSGRNGICRDGLGYVCDRFAIPED